MFRMSTIAQEKPGTIDLRELYYPRWNVTVRTSLLDAISTNLLCSEYSKLAVHLWTNNLAKRLTAQGSKVALLLVHPGAILSVRWMLMAFFQN